MNILLIGAGQIGSRHLQSLANLPSLKTVYVIEPNSIAEEVARSRWQEASKGNEAKVKFFPYHALNHQWGIAVAIIATPSAGRLEVFRKVFEMGIKYIISEKVLFQSIAEYRLALELCDQNETKVVSNHVYRYVEIFQQLRSAVGNKKIRMDVQVGNNGMGCNLIHFIDLFQYISYGVIQPFHTTIAKPLSASRRGDVFVEFTGEAEIWNDKGSRLQVVFSGSQPKPPIFTISFSGGTIRLDEGTCQVQTTMTGFDGLSFTSPQISGLTHIIVNELLSGCCRLPTLTESFMANFCMLQSLNMALFGNMNEDQVCPIT